MRKIGMVFMAIAFVGVLAASMCVADEAANAAAKDPTKLKAMCKGKSATEAAAIAADVVKAAIAAGGSERDIKKRLADVAACAIAAAGPNAPDVASALVKAGGDKYMAVIVAAISIGADVLGATPEKTVNAAVSAAGAANAKAAKDAADNPAQTLGGLTARHVRNLAERVSKGPGPGQGPKIGAGPGTTPRVARQYRQGGTATFTGTGAPAQVQRRPNVTPTGKR